MCRLSGSCFLGYFYPRPPRGGRPYCKVWNEWFRDISIHALREEGDRQAAAQAVAAAYFYPRPPRGGRRMRAHTFERFSAFLSTPSARRATSEFVLVSRWCTISIHALREEGDGRYRNKRTQPKNFYPRPPRGGRQQKQRKNPCFYSIINHSAQNGKSCNCAEHERCVFCGKNIRFSGAKKTEKA